MTKHCNNCDTDHDDESWGELTAVGLQRLGGELRMCACGSTLAIEVTLENAVAAFDRWTTDTKVSWSIVGRGNWMRLTVQSFVIGVPQSVSWARSSHTLPCVALKTLERAASVGRA